MVQKDPEKNKENQTNETVVEIPGASGAEPFPESFEGSFGMCLSAVTTSVFRHEWLPRLRLLPKES